MSRTTIDYGIDLGTTNSSIALATGTTTEVIRNNLDSEVTPSAVHINSTGALWVGQHARSRLTDARASGQVAIEFKRRIGTGHDYTFEPHNRKLRPEDLSAEILKALRADVALRKNEDISSAVITVPAAFELHQCEATKRAADLAGLTLSPLLQEPVAAALAYGYQKTDAKACWLVFDFGGGTFDAALVSSRGGLMHVVNHGGDSFLGGSDLDWAIVQQLLIPQIQKQFQLDDFQRGSPRYHHDLVRLKAAAEAAKIELSAHSEAHLDLVIGAGTKNALVFETSITRADVTRLAEPIVLKATHIAQRVLREKNLAPSAVAKLIFVGGPTLAPWFRETVQSLLKIDVDTSIDPMTAVARGAAIFASTQPLPKKAVTATPFSANTAIPLELLAKNIGSDPEPLVSGRLIAPASYPLKGHNIEFINSASKWRSGRQPLRDGAFQLLLRAEAGAKNHFTIELSTPSGELLPTSPAHFDYTLGVIIEEQPIINHLGVATADNKACIHFTKGQPLPARSTHPYRTAQTFKRGDTSDSIHIPIIEGNRTLADRNILIGTLHIHAANLTRDLPAGSEIEVTLKMDTSRLLTVQAYVPLLDAEFPATLELGGKLRQPDPALLRQELSRESLRLTELQERLTPATPEARDALLALANSPLHTQLAQNLSGQHTPDFDTLLRCERDLMELKDRLDEISSSLDWPLAVQDAENWLFHLTSVTDTHGTPEDRARAASLRTQVQDLLASKSLDRLRLKQAELSEVYSAILQRQPGFWTEYLENLATRLDQMRDPTRAGLLIKRARHAATSNQLETVKEVVFQLQDLLPRTAAIQARLGYGSSLVR